jgi:hypothetical protein
MTARPPVRVGTTMVWGLAPTLGIFLVIVVAIFIALGAGFATFGELTASGWTYAGAGAFKYFPLSMAIMITPVLLSVYVAQGVTRRQFAVGAVLFITAWSLLLALIMLVGYAVEAAAFGATGRPYVFDTPHLFDTWTDVHLVLGEHVTLIAVHMMTGWLIGTTYYVLGWFRATLLLPVTLLPVAAVEVLMPNGWIGRSLFAEFPAYTPPPVAAAIPLALLVIGITWAVNFILVRELPIKVKNA